MEGNKTCFILREFYFAPSLIGLYTSCYASKAQTRPFRLRCLYQNCIKLATTEIMSVLCLHVCEKNY
jgi:hypothetical protein